MIYDVAVIGMGFAGLSAVYAALKRGLNCVVIAPNAGASLHFSGAFDVADPFLFDKKFNFEEKISITDLVDKLTRFDPAHAYNRVLERDANILPNIIKTARDFFDFYNISVTGGDNGVMVFGSSGRPKLSAFSLVSQGLDFGYKRDRALVIDVPGVTDYPAALIAKNIQKYFGAVRVVTCTEKRLNFTAALASLVQLSESPVWRDEFKSFLSGIVAAGETIIMPPLLGVRDFNTTHQKFESDLKVKIVELLSVLPSVSGARVQALVTEVLRKKTVPLIAGTVVKFKSDRDQINAVVVKTKDGDAEIVAKEFVLATGKFIGGGVAKQNTWRETVFGFDLFSRQGPLTPQTDVSELISNTALEKQDVFSVGVQVDAGFRPLDHVKNNRYRNVKACGHVLTGFDFSRERCGFGISLATGLSVF